MLGCWLLLAAQPALAGKRVALVIGNGAYAESPLANPANDAQDMAAALKRLGFSVSRGGALTNLDRTQMNQAIRDFGLEARGAEAALFYFAGHGVQINGANYLLPVRQVFRDEGEVQTDAVEVNSILSRLEDAGAQVNMILLDACRNNPLPRAMRSGVRGLARMDAPRGSLVAFAAQPNDVAQDGSGRNGLYTKHLLAHLGTPGLPVESMFKRVRAAVEAESARSGHVQSPREETSLVSDFYFAPAGATSATPPVAGPAPAEPRDRRNEPPAAGDGAAGTEVAGIKVLKDAVLDTGTGLMWMRQGMRSEHKRSPANWYEARTWAFEMSQRAYAGFKDWRLPTLAELDTFRHNTGLQQRIAVGEDTEMLLAVDKPPPNSVCDGMGSQVVLHYMLRKEGYRNNFVSCYPVGRNNEINAAGMDAVLVRTAGTR